MMADSYNHQANNNYHNPEIITQRENQQEEKTSHICANFLNVKMSSSARTA